MNTQDTNQDSPLYEDIVAYNQQKDELEKSYFGKWVVFYKANLIGIYDNFESAADEAIKKFGRGPYLIRQIGEKPMVLPASVIYSELYHAG